MWESFQASELLLGLALWWSVSARECVLRNVRGYLPECAWVRACGSEWREYCDVGLIKQNTFIMGFGFWGRSVGKLDWRVRCVIDVFVFDMGCVCQRKCVVMNGFDYNAISSAYFYFALYAYRRNWTREIKNVSGDRIEWIIQICW